MRKIFTSKEILEVCLKNKEEEEKKDVIVEDPESEEIKEQNASFINNKINASINMVKLAKFKTNVKNHLLVEALSYIFNKSTFMEFVNEDNDVIKRNIVNKFVKENNVDGLLKSFKDKSILLSELSSIITEAYETVLETVDV